jgi:hypothetical protein
MEPLRRITLVRPNTALNATFMRRPAPRPGRAGAGRGPFIALLLSLPLALAVGGCFSNNALPSGSPAGSVPAQTATIDACSLITAAEVSGIVGGPAPVAKSLPGGGWVAGQCTWSGPSSAVFVSVGTEASIRAFGDPAAPDAKGRLAAFKGQLAGSGSATDVSGIGDGAVFGTAGIAAYAGGTYVEILRLSLSDDQLVQLATKIVGHL